MAATAHTTTTSSCTTTTTVISINAKSRTITGGGGVGIVCGNGLVQAVDGVIAGIIVIEVVLCGASEAGVRRAVKHCWIDTSCGGGSCAARWRGRCRLVMVVARQFCFAGGAAAEMTQPPEIG